MTQMIVFQPDNHEPFSIKHIPRFHDYDRQESLSYFSGVIYFS